MDPSPRGRILDNFEVFRLARLQVQTADSEPALKTSPHCTSRTFRGRFWYHFGLTLCGIRSLQLEVDGGGCSMFACRARPLVFARGLQLPVAEKAAYLDVNPSRQMGANTEF